MRHAGMMAALALALASCGPGTDTSNLAAEGNAASSSAAPAAPATAATGRQYAELVGAGDLYQVEAARLAQQNARRPEVREFAARLLADHRRSTAELVRAAAQARPPVRLAPALTAEQQAELQALQAAGRATFDPVFMRQQVNAHERALTLVTAYAAGGESEPLRRHAAGVAERIQRHLAQARRLEVPAPR